MITADRFADCLAFVLKAEGGFSNDPMDSGGATNLGITSETLAEYLGRPVTVADVRGLTAETAAAIYRARYWQPVHGDSLPAGVDLMAIDSAVNMGVRTAARMLQVAVGVPMDGVIGDQTLSALAHVRPEAVIQAMSAKRAQTYRALDDFKRFGAGWLNRLSAVTKQALQDAQ